MKISLISSILATTLFSGTVLAQTTRSQRNQANPQKRTTAPKRNVVKKKSTSTPKKVEEKKSVVSAVAVETKKEEVSKSSFDKFNERLGITYIGFFTSPPLGKWDMRNSAISPQWEGSCDNCDSYSMNIFNQINFSYNFGAKMKFNLIPRFSLFMGEAQDQAPGERSTFMMEDWLVGFSGTVYSSPDKKFNWWMRPGMRLPTSHFARHGADNATFGQYNYQLELLQTFSYSVNPTVEVGVTFQERVWIYENRYNWSRHRHLTNPYITFKLSDSDTLSFHYENMVENTRRWKSINGQEPKYEDVWQNAYVMWNKNITPKLTVGPALNAYVDDIPFSLRSFWLSAVIVYSIQ